MIYDPQTSLQSGFRDDKYFLEISENLLIKCDRPVLNKNSSSTKQFLLGNNSKFDRFCYTVILFYVI